MIETGFPTTGPTLGEVGEHEVIRAILGEAPSPFNGDDAAVLTPPVPNSRVVVTTDMLVQGRHFAPELTTPFAVGRKAVVQNFADIEAMGARPIAAVLAFSAPPELPLEVVRQFAAGIQSKVGEYTSELVGGDVTSGASLVLSISAVGSLGGSLPPLELGRARAGQRVVAHGKIGYSAAGLALLQSGADIPEHLHPLVHAYQAPELTPGRGMIARAAGATAMTDNSDGLVRDVGVLAERSKVLIDLDSAALAPDELQVAAGELLGIDPWQWVLSGGEDHTLLGTIDGSAPVGFRTIGEVRKGAGVLVDASTPAYSQGWESFS
ncbi:thiamine-phosphate kinase [Corynebacterium sanguinis]|uniref:thiamine-phosphate kinase n=1 Tax=Corynebacterium TaxID=1716 RepID=UPI00119F0A09|nr:MULTISPECIES: thiamine-phosphate kinase [Corynebacterium]MCT1414874.1 thiamine-phosphate kinase [Corynebacterium sanguinis]MCT1463869.1 thiamine-phosphate kinase [Corynebacterium sanguinis]MCT1555174.1 thiamine-phosphate kinase [Corynebacterium sanguinis]MCT1585428.1 thiamine-phosphate kinase [Corynebacterium sanguinis]MCT1664832.1 thiamine-phosphate kinase [Corynebacterium sanguinis]